MTTEAGQTKTTKMHEDSNGLWLIRSLQTSMAQVVGAGWLLSLIQQSADLDLPRYRVMYELGTTD